MIRRPPRSTLTYNSFPTRRSADLDQPCRTRELQIAAIFADADADVALKAPLQLPAADAERLRKLRQGNADADILLDRQHRPFHETILRRSCHDLFRLPCTSGQRLLLDHDAQALQRPIGRASWRERVCQYV